MLKKLRIIYKKVKMVQNLLEGVRFYQKDKSKKEEKFWNIKIIIRF